MTEVRIYLATDTTMFVSSADLELIRKYFDALDRETKGRPYVKREVEEMLEFYGASQHDAKRKYEMASGILEENQMRWCTTFDPRPCQDRWFARAVGEEALKRGYEPALGDLDNGMGEMAQTFSDEDFAKIYPDNSYRARGMRRFDIAALRILDRFDQISIDRTFHVIELTFEKNGLVVLLTEDFIEVREPTLEWCVDEDEHYKSSAYRARFEVVDEAMNWIEKF